MIFILVLQLLYEFLNRGELTMIQLHLLIFADLSELRGQTLAYIQMVMKNFYMATDQLLRPRILGFLPSLPQNVPSDISDLEGIMDSKLLHIDDYSFNRPSTHFSELVLFYERTRLAVTPILVEQLESLRSLEPTDGFVLNYSEDSRCVLEEVGTCASDIFWRHALREFNESSSCDIRVESNRRPIQKSIQDCIRDWTFTLPNLDPASPKFNVTHKFVMLVKALRSCGPYGETFRGVILGMSTLNIPNRSDVLSQVKKRAVAFAIRDMLRMLDVTPLFFRPLLVTSNALYPAIEHTVRSMVDMTRASINPSHHRTSRTFLEQGSITF